LAASRGATDFGEYFTYFSFFLVVSALMLASLFFRLGVEQRAREIGLLRSVGYTNARVTRLFVMEGVRWPRSAPCSASAAPSRMAR
jgi:cell division protein FtsX